MFDENHPLYATYRVAKRIAICIVGGSVLLVGIAMIVLPGPAFVVIPAGLAILGIEFAWARIWLKKAKAKAQEVASTIATRTGISKSGAKNGPNNDDVPPPPSA